MTQEIYEDLATIRGNMMSLYDKVCNTLKESGGKIYLTSPLDMGEESDVYGKVVVGLQVTDTIPADRLQLIFVDSWYDTSNVEEFRTDTLCPNLMDDLRALCDVLSQGKALGFQSNPLS